MNNSQLILNYNSKPVELNHHTNAMATKAIQEVIQNHLLRFSVHFTLTLCCHREFSCTFYNNLLDNLFRVWGLSVMKLSVLKNNSNVRVQGSRRSNLILIDSFAAFREIDIASYKRKTNYNDHYYIFIHERDLLLQTELQQIFAYCWANLMINCSVQSQNALGEIFVHSYFPYTSDSCCSVKPELINRFNGSQFINGTLFPRKLSNLHGCTLKAAMWHIPPFVYLKTDAQGVTRIAGGIEGRLLQLLAKRLNFTIEVKVPLYSNETHKHNASVQRTAAFNMIIRQEVDLLLGGFVQTSVLADNASNVANYYQTRQVMAVVKAAYYLTSWEKIICPFDLSTWTYILCAGIGCWILGYLFHKYHWERVENAQSIQNIIAGLLGLPVTNVPLRSHTRLLFTTWLCFTLLFRSIYQGILFSYSHGDTIMPIPKELEDIYARNLTIVMTSFNQKYLSGVQIINDLPSIFLATRDGVSIYEYIVKHRQRNLVAIAPQDFLYLYRLTHKKYGRFVVLPDDLMNLQITMYLIKHSYFTDKFEFEIWWMRSAGLLKGFAGVELGNQQLMKATKEYDEELDVNDIFATFGLLGAGLGMSFLVFVFELLSLRIQLLRRWLVKLHT